MAKRKETIIWSEISGALLKPKRLHLEKDIEGSYKCPVPDLKCHHEGFTSQRVCRKHVKVSILMRNPTLRTRLKIKELPIEVLNESHS